MEVETTSFDTNDTTDRKLKKNVEIHQELIKMGLNPISLSNKFTLKLVLGSENFQTQVSWKDVARAMKNDRVGLSQRQVSNNTPRKNNNATVTNPIKKEGEYTNKRRRFISNDNYELEEPKQKRRRVQSRENGRRKSRQPSPDLSYEDDYGELDYDDEIIDTPTTNKRKRQSRTFDDADSYNEDDGKLTESESEDSFIDEKKPPPRKTRKPPRQKVTRRRSAPITTRQNKQTVSLNKTPNNGNLTPRQRAMLSSDKTERKTLFESYDDDDDDFTPTKKDKKGDFVLNKRQQKILQQLEEEKNQIIALLLDIRPKVEYKKEEKKIENPIILKKTPTSTQITYPHPKHIPDILRKSQISKGYPPPRPSCSVCTKQQKYIHSELKLPVCSLQCYKILSENNK